MNGDELDRLLEQLPKQDVDQGAGARIREAIHQAFGQEPRGPGVYHRVVEPALVALACSAHLWWAIANIVDVLR